MVHSRVGRDEAEEIAIRALGFLAGDADRLGRFLALTGIDPAEIRALAGKKSFLVSVLDHVMGDESLLLAFSANAGIAPDKIAPARHRLDGAAD